MAGKSVVRDIDKGWKRLTRDLAEFSDSQIFVGIHEDAKASDESGELSAASLAAVHEFGSSDGRIPERSFLRAGMDHYQKQISEAYGRAFSDIVKGRLGAQMALNRLGLLGQSLIRKYLTTIGQTVWEDITEATKRRKGSSKILIDTGQLRRGIDYSIRPISERTEAINGRGASRANMDRGVDGKNTSKSRRKSRKKRKKSRRT